MTPFYTLLLTMLRFSEFNELEKPKALSQGSVKRRTKNIYKERQKFEHKEIQTKLG